MFKYSKISTQKIHKILQCFCEDIPAVKTAVLVGLNRNTIDRFYNIFREKILLHEISDEYEYFSGEVEVDESYFWAKRVRGKRGRWAAGKTPVFWLLKRDGKVFVRIVENCSRDELMPVIQGKILEGSTIYSDGWRAYDGLLLNGYDHYRIYHSENEFARGKNHVNWIEAFWSFAKRRLSKFNGIASHKFILYLKECEFRWNHRDKKNLFHTMKSILTQF